MSYRTIQVRFEEPICYIRFYRPEQKNTINSELVDECHAALNCCEASARIVVLEGLSDVFCLGADFVEIKELAANRGGSQLTAEPLYKLWGKLATGPYITIAHVRGKANAGGIGFVAASDIVLAADTAEFSLSELLFGLLPACVLPFLIRRIGLQKAKYMTLMTQPISVQQAYNWGLVDAYEQQSDILLRKHLLRLRPLSKASITRFKRYVNQLNTLIADSHSIAVALNHEVFSDPVNISIIARYLEKGLFPWEE